MMNKKLTQIVCAGIATIMITSALAGCNSDNNQASSQSESSSDSSSTTASSTSVSGSAADVLGIDASKYDDIESKADLSSTNLINFSNSSINVENNCAKVDGNTVTISSAGTYILSGTLDD